jgi:hypothetical protein
VAEMNGTIDLDEEITTININKVEMITIRLRG